MNTETAQLLQAYIAAFNASNFDAMDTVLEQAQTNKELEKFIRHYHSEMAEEVHLTPEQREKLRNIIEREG